MSILVLCPSCQSGFSVSSEDASGPRQCPDCGYVFAASKSREAASTAPPTPMVRRPPVPPPVQPRSLPLDDIPFGLPADVPVARPVTHTEVAAPPVIGRPRAEPVAPPKANVPVKVTAPAGQPRKTTVAAPLSGDDDDDASSAPIVEMLLVCVPILLLLCVGIGTAYVFLSADEKQAASLEIETQVEPPSVAIEPYDPEAAAKDNVAAGPMPAQTVTRIQDDVSSCAVTLAVESAAGTRRGGGFVFDQRGWLITSYRFVKDAYEVRAEFLLTPARLAADEATVVKCLGIVASLPHLDLAVVALDPKRMPTFPQWKSGSAASLKKEAFVLCCRGREEDTIAVDQCQVVNIATSAQLPGAVRAELTHLDLAAPAEARWIVFDQPIEPSAQFLPVVDALGEIVGFNMPLAAMETRGVALPVDTLTELAGTADGPMHMFTRPSVVANASPQKGITRPQESALASTDPAVNPLAYIDLVKRAHERCSSNDWDTKSESGFADFQRLLRLVGEVLAVEDNPRFEEGVRVIAAAPAHEVALQLKTVPWPDEAEILRLNQDAVSGLKKANTPIVAYCQVVQPSRRSSLVDGKPTILLHAIGNGELFLYPLEKHRGDLRVDSRCLIIGFHETAAEDIAVELAGTENAIPLIRPKYLFTPPSETPSRPRLTPNRR